MIEIIIIFERFKPGLINETSRIIQISIVYPTEILNFKKNGDKNKPPLTLHIFVLIF